MAQTVNAVDVNFSIGDIIVGCATGATLTVSRAMDAATCGASGGWAQNSPGLKSWSGSVSANFRKFTTQEAATNIGPFDIFELLDEGTLVDVEYGTIITGDKRFHGTAYISGLTFTEPETGVVTWSADLTGDGAITVVTVAA
jgi:hypothetical protein